MYAIDTDTLVVQLQDAFETLAPVKKFLFGEELIESLECAPLGVSLLVEILAALPPRGGSCASGQPALPLPPAAVSAGRAATEAESLRKRARPP